MKILVPSRRSGSGFASCIALVAASVLLSGCMGAPTYGTGTPADEQLLEDVTGILSLAPDDQPQIEYKPRPELVTPASTEVLPEPQQSVTTASNPAWPEAPEQRRERLRAEATANQDDASYDPVIENDVAAAPRQPVIRTRGFDVPVNNVAASSGNQREQFNRRLAATQQGSPTERRFLSEPPLDYRTPAPTAPVGDIGEDEWKKERRLKAEARKAAGKTSWADVLPW